MFCVTPNNGTTTGSQVCTGWTSVGHTVTFYKDSGYSSTHLTLAYEKAGSGTCLNVYDYLSSFNDDASSYKFYATSSSTTLTLYKDGNCSGTTTSRTVSASGNDLVSSMSGTLGSTWQDSLSSIKVKW